MTGVQILDGEHNVKILLNQEVTVFNLPRIVNEVKDQRYMIRGQWKKKGGELIHFHESRLGMPNHLETCDP